MTMIFVHKIIDAPFNSVDDLKELFYSNACSVVVLGVKDRDRLATVEQKKPFKGVCGWRISYGIDLGRAYMLESKATAPSNFKQDLLCSYNYTVEIL